MDNPTKQRLSDLLLEPAETLEVEIKNWLNVSDKGNRADIAKELIALANHGGGYLIFGFAEPEKGSFVVDANRPPSLTVYSSDELNGIVSRYAEPEFHCDVSLVEHPRDRQEFPIVIVPGEHSVPIRAKRDGPNNEVRQNVYYIRRPGAKSEPPQSGREWDELILRCVKRRQEDMLDAIRAILSGQVQQQATAPTDQERLNRWTRESLERWREVTAGLSETSPARFPDGHYYVSFLLLGDFEQVPLARFRQITNDSVVRYSGWPPFVSLTSPDLAPYSYGNAIECWVQPDGSYLSDAAHSDFWRGSPDGAMFLIRGFQEDTGEVRGVQPKIRFDVALPIYRIGECLLYADRLAANLGMTRGRVLFEVGFAGLQNRTLTSLSGTRAMLSHRVSRQDRFNNVINVELDKIQNNLPEVLLKLLSDLYAQFEFFELTPQLVNSVVAEMKKF